MKRSVYGLSLAAAVLLLAAVPSRAGAHGWHGHGWHRHHAPRVVVGIGSGFWWGPSPRWYAPPPVHVVPPRLIVREPPVYIERAPASPSASYWYYCESAGAYYPNVPTCPEPWVKVPPRID
jgi:hypothetical protein